MLKYISLFDALRNGIHFGKFGELEAINLSNEPSDETYLEFLSLHSAYSNVRTFMLQSQVW